MKKSFELTLVQVDRIIEMAWEDRTPFEAIRYQFGLYEKEVIKLMRGNLKRSSFNRWRKRVHSGVSQKHLKKRTQTLRVSSVRDKRPFQETKLASAYEYLV